MENITKISIFLLVFLAVFLSASFASAQYYTGLCIPHASNRCVGSNVYWYDSCGNQQELLQYCPQGCLNGVCANNYNNNNNYNYNNSCNYHAYRDCVGSSIYWYDSCGIRQDLYQSCSNYEQTCQYGQCVSNYNPAPTPVPIPYVLHYRTGCYGNNLYWYDSLGSASGLYKNCHDANSCTVDSCKTGKCSNVLKCDGSTCAVGSADYNNYCAQPTPVNHCGNGTCEPNLGETSANCQSDCRTGSAGSLSVSFVTKKDVSSQQWDKAVQASPDTSVYFMIAVNNNSASQIDNVNVSANVPSEISSLGNLKVDDIAISGDIVAGVNIGSVGPKSSKSITFEGRTFAFTTQDQKQATVSISPAGGVTQSDSVEINFNPTQQAANAASVSSSGAVSGFIGFLKRWYLWILVGLVLIFLFVVVFRRLSSNT